MSGKPKTTLSLVLKPFTVPNFVIVEGPPGSRDEGFRRLPSYPLSAVDPLTLAQMCEEFRRAVFVKAGHPLPEAQL